jgi:hypothetical protein
MPILNNPIDTRYEGRTQTMLVVSEGRAPAENWLPSDATNGTVQFNYAFGPQYNSEVVIPKGKIVAAAGVEYDVVTEKYVPRLKISNETDIPLGVNHHNVYQTKRDRFSGNGPTVITRDYIRVPLFVDTVGATAHSAADAIKFGAMHAQVSATDPAAIATAIYGQYVVSDQHGNFTIPGTLATDIAAGRIVGQVYGLDTNMPPAGYLQYFTEMTEGELYDLIQKSAEITSAGRTTAAITANDLSIGTFPIGSTYLKSKEDLAYILKDFRAGIPFLTDGYFKARTQVTLSALGTSSTLSAELLEVRATANVTIAADDFKVTVSDPIGAMIFVKFANELCKDTLQVGDVVGNHPELNGQVNTLTVTIDSAPVSSNNLEVDYANNMIVIYPTAPISDKAIGITATVLKNQIPGVPSNWDFKGCFGEARILLQK